ncbi:GNAT family N-acetyltransferase [Goekera deserti]|uniref:GNAT family N-acetyltransferase n=1 Tax=Goekera deserti TaxID=2497753 RepID=A0A7K3WHJ1_9ACTN|nr:GNAT family N-acetyltransferase [Goekera deserti]NDI49828.1 GNAT family N-acetyltransferase [Goekera deserti]NEL55190.1 GNAT family N-acetyltransferase [Goekera deserti]
MPVPLTTARLTLLPWALTTEAHRDGLVTAWDDPEVWHWVGAGRDGFTRADLDSAIERATAQGRLDDEFLVVRTCDGTVLGVCGLYPSSNDGGDPAEWDLGYRYGRLSWGQGHGFEAAAEVLRWAREERGLRRVGSNAQLPNEASHRILRRLGFTPIGTRPDSRDPARTTLWYAWTA